MSRLRVREFAEALGLNMSQLQAAINRRLPAEQSPVALGTVRRYWYGTKDGNANGTPIELVDIHLLGTIARVLGVRPSDLLNEDELGQWTPALLAVA